MDDPEVTVRFGVATYTAAEGGSVSVTVELTADPEWSFTIPTTKSEQDGATDGDYGGVPASVAFNSGETAKAFTFTATQARLTMMGRACCWASARCRPPGPPL